MMHPRGKWIYKLSQQIYEAWEVGIHERLYPGREGWRVSFKALQLPIWLPFRVIRVAALSA